MNFTFGQKIYVVFFLVLFCFLYFGFSTTPKKSKLINESRNKSVETIQIDAIESMAHSKIEEGVRKQLDSIEKINVESEKFKGLSSIWYSNANYLLSGHYAELAANAIQSADSYSIAGSTFYTCMIRTADDDQRTYCKTHAVENFDNALSLEPNNINYQINKSLIYIENPDDSGPMKGIQMLLALNKENPKNPKVLYHLAQLSLRSNQLEKARQRIESVLELTPNDSKSICLAAKIYSSLRNFKKAEEYSSKCKI